MRLVAGSIKHFINYVYIHRIVVILLFTELNPTSYMQKVIT